MQLNDSLKHFRKLSVRLFAWHVEDFSKEKRTEVERKNKLT